MTINTALTKQTIYFGGLIQDRLWFDKEKTIAILDKELSVIKRYRKLDGKIWNELFLKLGWDDQGHKKILINITKD